MVIKKYKKSELPIIDYELATTENVANLLRQNLSGLVYVYRDKK